MMHGHGGLRGCPLAYDTYRTSRHPVELWTTSWVRGPISGLSSWGDVLDPLIRWTTSWIHGSIWRCSPWDGDELRHHEDMHNVHSHGLRLSSRTPLRWCVVLSSISWSHDILQMSAPGWTPPSRPLILRSHDGDIMTMVMTSTTTGVVLLAETLSLCGASGGLLWDAHAVALPCCPLTLRVSTARWAVWYLASYLVLLLWLVSDLSSDSAKLLDVSVTLEALWALAMLGKPCGLSSPSSP